MLTLDRSDIQRALVNVTKSERAAVAVQTVAAPTATPRKAMCSLCRAVDAASSIALFAARRSGPDGRKGDTVGTSICSGLDCSAQLRIPTPKVGRAIIGAKDADLDLLAADMLDRLDTFLTSVGV